ncbi:hypothetical protein [Limnohabitans sp. WS1]|uniref:RCC1 domain-containing protein n=1 Tax=Limnohabitans sp. WS1 TaxID=1100726 RepID=UPI00130502F1|nr:hypothetical protein [Limnohabitans sp. WS1]
MSRNNWLKTSMILCALLLQAACGGGGGGGGDAGGGTVAGPFALAGQVEGLLGSGLAVQDGLGNTLSIPGGATSFAFNSGSPYLATGAVFDLQVQSQPTGQVCVFTNGSGVAKVNMGAIKINCATVGLTTASLSESQLQWRVQTPIQVNLKSEAGQTIGGKLTCQSTNLEALEVASDCSWAKALRLGNYTISVLSSAGHAANANVSQIPQRHALPATSQAANLFAVNPSQGTALLWGSGAMGKLAQFDANIPNSDSPKPLVGQLFVANFNTIRLNTVSLALGSPSASSLALSEAGEVVSWGGDGTTLGRTVTAGVSTGKVITATDNVALKNMVQVQAGQKNAAALRDDGRVYSWGLANGSGQGLSGLNSVNANVVMVGPNTPLTAVVQISAGDNYTLALTASGEVYVWGSNQGLKLPNAEGSVVAQYAYATPINDPLTKTPLQNVVSISAGSTHALALTAQGNVLAWGNNQFGQLGRGNTFSNVNSGFEPGWVKAPLLQGGNLNNIKAIAAGQNHNLALTNNGSIVSWGPVSNPQLGWGSKTIDRGDLPSFVVNATDTSTLANIVAISATATNSYALTSKGEVLSWGYNYSGALGLGVLFTELAQAVKPQNVVSGNESGTLSVGDMSQFKNLNQRYR